MMFVLVRGSGFGLFKKKKKKKSNKNILDKAKKTGGDIIKVGKLVGGVFGGFDGYARDGCEGCDGCEDFDSFEGMEPEDSLQY